MQCGVKLSTGSLEGPELADGTIVLATAADAGNLIAKLDCRPDEIPERGKEDFLVRRVDANGKSLMLVLGGDDLSVLYGAYALLEEMGWSFQISKDVLPRKTEVMPWPEVNRRLRARATRRGVLLATVFPDLAVFGLKDYTTLLDQMAKLRLNWFVWWHINNCPWLDFKWKGERPILGDNGHPDAGFCLWRGGARSFRTDDLPVGRHHFPTTRMVPIELAECVTEEEFLEKGRWFLSRIFDLAVERGVEPSFCFDPRTSTTNHGRLLGGRPEGSFGGYVGTNLPVTHPDLAEFNRTRIRAIMTAYPQVRCLSFNISEHAVVTDSTEELALFKRMQEEAGPAWEEALKAHRLSWRESAFPVEGHFQSGLGWIHVMRDIAAFCEKEYPHVTLMGLGINRADVLHLTDVLLPKNVQFSDMHGSCAFAAHYTGARLPLEIFGDVPKRRTTLICPRLDDDQHMTELNFHVRQYINDGFFDGCARIGMTGMMIQTFRPRGQEHNMRFLSETLWESGLTEDGFYRRYCGRLFGEASEKMRAAYKTLEDENERFLVLLDQDQDQRYAEPLWAQGIKAFVQQPHLVNGPFAPANRKGWAAFTEKAREFQTRAVGLDNYDRAALLLREALPLAPEGSKDEVRYLSNRVEVFRKWSACLVDCLPFAERYEEAFRRKADGDRKGFLESLASCRAQADALVTRQKALTEQFSEIMDSPNDLGLLFSLNRLGMAIFGELACAVRQVDDFHNGRAFWRHRPDWRNVNDGGDWCGPYNCPLDAFMTFE